MNKFKEFLASINWSEVKPHTVVSLILQVLAWINMGLTAAGKPVIDVHEDVINQIVGWVFVFGTSAYGNWKNHSFTWFAQTGDKDLFEKELDDVAEGKESDDIVG